MKKVRGILALLVIVTVLTSILSPNFLKSFNLENIIRWTGLFGIPSIGEAFVIITGGIDLSVGSVIGLTGTLLPLLLAAGMPVWLTVLLVMGVALLIGMAHGLLVTKVKMQPFVVTLCGLLLYRGIARYISGDATQGFGTGYTDLRYLAQGTPFSIPIPGIGWIAIPMPFLILVAVALVSGVLLNRSIYGRYLLALGRNEQAARFSGINTDRMILLAYTISAALSGFSGMMFALDINSVQPSGHGNFYELYAIAAAVLGGCSLRGGEGTILGVVLGTAIVRVLYNAINVLGIPTQLEYAVIGAVILFGVATDELLKRFGARRTVSPAPAKEEPG